MSEKLDFSQPRVKKVGPAHVWNVNQSKRVPEDAVYIGRGSPYGNPFKIGPDGTRAEVIQRFECEVLPQMDVEPLRGKDLVCHCAPANCHGYSILRKLYGVKK